MWSFLVRGKMLSSKSARTDPCNHWIAWYDVKPCIAWDQSCNHCAAREKAGQAMVTFRKFELSTLLVISLRILYGFYRSFN